VAFVSHPGRPEFEMRLLTLLLLSLFVSPALAADEYPNRRVEIVVPYAPAFRFETPECSIVYSGDSGPTVRCGHLELASMAAEARAPTVVLTHITEQFDHPGLRERTVSEMAHIYPGTIIFGEDGTSIPIKSRGPLKLA
jgi:ribonuclease BN (tRNA processing enzyme)